MGQKWVDYDSTISAKIESVYVQKRNVSNGSESVLEGSLNVTVNGVEYLIDLPAMQQRDGHSSRGVCRRIKRYTPTNQSGQVHASTSQWKLEKGCKRVTNQWLLREGNDLMTALGSKGHLEHAGIIFDLLETLNITKNLYSYTTMISKAGTWQQIGKLFYV